MVHKSRLSRVGVGAGAGQKTAAASPKTPALDVHAQFGLEVSRKWRQLATFYFRATATAPFFYFRSIATSATFSGSRQWRGGAKSDANAQH